MAEGGIVRPNVTKNNQGIEINADSKTRGDGGEWKRPTKDASTALNVPAVPSVLDEKGTQTDEREEQTTQELYRTIHALQNKVRVLNANAQTLHADAIRYQSEMDLARQEKIKALKQVEEMGAGKLRMSADCAQLERERAKLVCGLMRMSLENHALRDQVKNLNKLLAIAGVKIPKSTKKIGWRKLVSASEPDLSSILEDREFEVTTRANQHVVIKSILSGSESSSASEDEYDGTNSETLASDSEPPVVENGDINQHGDAPTVDGNDGSVTTQLPSMVQSTTVDDGTRNNDSSVTSVASTSTDQSTSTSPPQPCVTPAISQECSQELNQELNGISLAEVPSNAIERSLYNHYKMLLLMICHRLLCDDIDKLKAWAAQQNISVDTDDLWQIFTKLDEHKVFHASNLTRLRAFLFDILRIDLVHIIDLYNRGDYTYLKKAKLSGELPIAIRPYRQNVPEVARATLKTSKLAEASAKVTAKKVPLITKETEPDYNGDTTREGNLGSNGRKHSKLSASDKSDTDNWLCAHYKRRCRVKFNCCQQYWPCHRCHNEQSKCGNATLKSRDTTYLKCEACGNEQKMSKSAQFCSNCHIKFAEYFCKVCGHLTSTDDDPYHCDKCDICRIHKSRSFHCDVCGVCLDIQLKDKHKCRADSAHDECCICLEDAFNGCQILPCSHKVHKECAIEMVQNGIKNCPICRESFAHKISNSQGKKGSTNKKRGKK